MSRNKRNFNRKEAKDFDETNPVMAMFAQCSKELDDKQDRKIWEGHYDRKQTDHLSTAHHEQQILSEALARLSALYDTNFANIARELRGLDPYQYARAFSPGLQEFVEALTYYEYVNSGKILDWTDVQNRMTYDENTDSSGDKETLEVDGAADRIVGYVERKSFRCLVQPMVMRRCITSLGSGDVETCFQACAFLQSLYNVVQLQCNSSWRRGGQMGFA